jgi:uncharacterized delta-60 repeat protein
VVGLVLAVLVLSLGSAQADTSTDGGALDTTFGTSGMVKTPLSQWGDVNGDVTAVAVQPDGKILVGGYLSGLSGGTEFAVARYLPDGALDPSFGNGGLVTTCVCSSFGNGPESVGAIVVLPDGKIVAIGDGDRWIELVRYNPNGSLDTSFGTGGISPDPNSTAYPPPGLSGGVFGAVLQPDGKIVVLGGPATLARFNADGTLDNSFGTHGVADCSGSCYGSWGPGAIALGPNGSIIVGGTSVSGDGNPADNSWLAERYLSDGWLDPSFGSGGIATVPDGGAGTMAIQPNGKIVLGGQRNIPMSSSSAALTRLNQNGTLDTTFGTDGVVVTQDPNTTQQFALSNAQTVLVQPDGKIVAVGYLSEGALGPGIGFGLERFLQNGAVDQSFGTYGVMGATFGSRYNASVRAAVLQPDGKVLAVGSGWPADPTSEPEISWLAMRSLPDDSEPVEIFVAGSGSGTVDSQPVGINCKYSNDCAAQFLIKSTVTLTAHPAEDSAVSWSGACRARGPVCQFTVQPVENQVQVTFSLCEVPHLHKKRLARAEGAIRRAHCAVGSVARKPSRTVARDSVISQSPWAGREMPVGTKVDLVVSKGKRR